VIRDAYARRAELAGDITDDAQLVEASGHPVSVVESDFTNLKITTRPDVTLANSIIKARPQARPKGPLGAFDEAQW
jgi:2-C-methyl-D-erythritol 4-phosphate cytidylyltransferase